MTWISTWPLNNVPQFAAHETEQEAEAHAKQLRAQGHPQAVHFWLTTQEAS